MQRPTADPPSHGPVGRPDARSKLGRLAAGLGVIALVGALAYATTMPISRVPTASPGSAGTSSAASSPANGRPVSGLGTGLSAPDFVTADDAHEPLLMDLDGRPIRLADFAGKPLWIVFWASWCIPCQQEASDVRAAYHAHTADGLAILAIDVQEPAAAVRAYVVKNDLDYLIGLDPTAAVRDMYGNGLPIHYFLDREGVIRDRYLGQMTSELMEQHLAAIIGS